MADRPIIVVGAGLVGSLLATMLSKAGKQVDVYEKRADPRGASHQEGRSINLALSHRGIRALKEAGVFQKIERSLIPMHGRKMHDVSGELTFQPYGKEGQFINSVSRGDLNLALINEAESQGAHFHFEHECSSVDSETSTLSFDFQGSTVEANGACILGTDGAFSAIRAEMKKSPDFEESVEFIEHGYKELRMPPVDGNFAMEPNFLHIWPRGRHMLIALPNPDKSFTCTLFLSMKGELSFDSLTKENLEVFFKRNFPDVPPLILDITDQFFDNPTGSLVTVKCQPWCRNKTLILGDAAHAIVPFYGQGMNSGFEDCTLLMDMLRVDDFNFDRVLPEFAEVRKPDGDAIADLAMKNFIEMRDWVGDENFLKRKRIEAELHEQFPDVWIPQYSMVTFSDIAYSTAMKLGRLQDQIMEWALVQDEVPSGDHIIQRFLDLRGKSGL